MTKLIVTFRNFANASKKEHMMKSFISFAPYYILPGNQIKNDEVGRASSRHEEVKVHKTF